MRKCVGHVWELAEEWRVKMRKNRLEWRGQLAKAAILFAAILFFSGLWDSVAWPQAVSQDPAVERGHKQFQQSCGFCHGPDATGARGPDLVRSPLVAHDVKGDKIGEVIRLGRPDKGMPAMPVTDQQVLDIAAYLHARAVEGVRSGEVPSSYPIEKLLTGDPEAGKTYFNGAGGCKSCHSPTGDLATVAAKYSIAVVTLPSGEQVKGPLAHADDFVVALRDGSGWYRSFLRDGVKVELQDPLAAHRELLDKLTQADVHNLFAYLESLK
jgi:cytochrome c oxidase cbb3-type subunit 3